MSGYGQGDYAPEDGEDRVSRQVQFRPQPNPGESIGHRQDRLWKAVEVLDNALEGLHHRVAPVLLPERPSPALGAVSLDGDAASEHGAFLDRVAERVDSLARRVGELSERVDL